jgi:gas vesicle protein
MNNRMYYSEEAKTYARRQKIFSMVVSLSLGLSLGALLALLFAPAKGENTRDELASTLSDGLSNGRDATQTVLAQLGEELSALRKSVEERIGQ